MSSNIFTIFYHVAIMGNWEYVHAHMIELFDKYEVSQNVIICVNGDYNEFIEKHMLVSSIKNIILLHSTVEYFEFTTLNFLKQHAEKKSGLYFYVHTKGASTPLNACIDDWRELMMFFLFSDIKTSLKYLRDYDTIGVDLNDVQSLHYSGNFWGATSKHIQKLPYLKYSQPRHDAEKWICSFPGKFYELHNSKINVFERHLHRYPKETYQLLIKS